MDIGERNGDYEWSGSSFHCLEMVAIFIQMSSEFTLTLLLGCVGDIWDSPDYTMKAHLATHSIYDCKLPVLSYSRSMF